MIGLQRSEYLGILQSLQARVEALELTFNGTVVKVEIKKIVQWLQGIGMPEKPIVLVGISDRPEDVQPFTTEDETLVKYYADIVMIAPGNRDNSANIDLWLSWREQQRRLVQWGLQSGVMPLTNAFFAQMFPDPPILREAALKNYDVSGLGVKIWNVEARYNNQLPV